MAESGILDGVEDFGDVGDDAAHLAEFEEDAIVVNVGGGGGEEDEVAGGDEVGDGGRVVELIPDVGPCAVPDLEVVVHLDEHLVHDEDDGFPESSVDVDDDFGRVGDVGRGLDDDGVDVEALLHEALVEAADGGLVVEEDPGEVVGGAEGRRGDGGVVGGREDLDPSELEGRHELLGVLLEVDVDGDELGDGAEGVEADALARGLVAERLEVALGAVLDAEGGCVELAGDAAVAVLEGVRGDVLEEEDLDDDGGEGFAVEVEEEEAVPRQADDLELDELLLDQAVEGDGLDVGQVGEHVAADLDLVGEALEVPRELRRDGVDRGVLAEEVHHADLVPEPVVDRLAVAEDDPAHELLVLVHRARHVARLAELDAGDAALAVRVPDALVELDLDDQVVLGQGVPGVDVLLHVLPSQRLHQVLRELVLHVGREELGHAVDVLLHVPVRQPGVDRRDVPVDDRHAHVRLREVVDPAERLGRVRRDLARPVLGVLGRVLRVEHLALQQCLLPAQQRDLVLGA
mmetsp:Transcript_13688/g.43224  ORF Transcript_13688/g.43224 Transcript_13688/m.43224 type:complete len:517 (+) Transcript_13688:554-2104(+)